MELGGVMLHLAAAHWAELDAGGSGAPLSTTRASSRVGRCEETAELSREIGRKWPLGGICGSVAIGIEWDGWQEWEKSLI